MTVFKKPVPDENTSEHTDATHMQAYTGISTAMPPLLLNGKRQFIRPVVPHHPDQPPRYPRASLAPASQLPVKKQFMSPFVSSGKPLSSPFAQAAQTG
ncbi:MAG TPA: hypothetical protein VKR42_05215, partial [Ktedonobacteraceae bacterium]|nr:hypothetical protein [Ktedonobacteraceae bacterium]